MTTPVRQPTAATTWRNWSGLEQATPVVTATPRSVDEVADAVRRAREAGTTVKMTGTGHSFTGIAAPEHTLLRPDGLSGVLEVDRQAMTVTA
ncbi:MAG TPA: FAD-binding protein, partial [Nocardioides sp.]|nr:FAD-binding protein [Nocardioides sp.]